MRARPDHRGGPGQRPQPLPSREVGLGLRLLLFLWVLEHRGQLRRYFGRNTRAGVGSGIAVFLLLVFALVVFLAVGGPAWLLAHGLP